MKLYPHQQRFLNENHKCHLLAYDTGLGKTYTSLMWLKKNNIRHALIICPKTILTQWEDEIAKHIPEIPTKVVTKEQFRDKYDKSLPTQAIIIDEAHVVASTTSQLHKEVAKYLKRHKVPYRLFLTATPVLSKGSMNIYALATLLGYDINYKRWRDTFQKQIIIRNGPRVIRPWKDKEDKETQDRLIAYINKIGTLIDKSEVYKVPDQTEHVHSIPYTKDLEEKIREELDGETEAIVMWTVRHRLEQSIKFDQVKELASKYKRVMIVCRYTSDVEHYSTIFPGADVLIGSTKDRGPMLKRIKDADEAIIIVNSAISEGWEFPDCEAIIFSSLDFSYKNYKQMLGRALRMNRPSPTDIHILVTKGGSDENVYKSIMKKQDFSIKMFLNNLSTD